MLTGPHFRGSVLAAKERVAAGREKLKQQHQNGSPGIQVCARLTDLLDSVVTILYEAAMRDLEAKGAGGLRSQIAIVPLGGYGRRDVAPYSDVDLMILHRPSASRQVGPLARRLMSDVFDAGLVLGLSVRTPAQACGQALKDPTIFTSLVEARHLAGSAHLYSKFAAKFRRRTKWRVGSLIASVQSARRQERAQYGETVYLLQPNLKCSRGGLRDIQLVRWTGFARWGEAEPQRLHLAGVLSKEDQRRLREASEFLLRLRNELHFHAEKPYDVLDRGEQIRLAELWGYPGCEGLLPVEQFMQEYFHHTSGVRDTAAHFVASARPRNSAIVALAPLLSHQVERDFRVGPIHISATRRGLAKLRSNLAEVLRLMELAGLYDKRIDHGTWEAIRQAMSGRADGEVSYQASQRFLSLMGQPGSLGDLLRGLHELRVLEQLIPGLNHARCLLQFNQYHKYTVDEHCIRGVECATEFISDAGPLGQAYRGMKQKRTLHLAMLVHDLGKGFVEDHSKVGVELAKQTARRLNLPRREAETLVFLVEKHLRMSHLAFWRDTSEQEIVVQFAAEVGSPERLQMLYVLTCADLAAVGPGVLNQWKLELLTQLYDRTMHHLTGGAAPTVAEERKEKVRACAVDSEHAEWLDRQIEALPPACLFGTSPRQIVDDLSRLRHLARDEATAWGRYLDDRRAVEFIVGTYEQITRGIFHKLTGALTSHRLQILSAEINTLADGLVFDRFYVHDPDFDGPPPPERLSAVSETLVEAIHDSSGGRPVFGRLWQTHQGTSQAALPRPPTDIRIDNNTSDRFTILDIFTRDRMGLLYTIARTLFKMEISVSVAKIGTYVDQVVDVFYVTDAAGRKIVDEERLQQIRTRLLERLESIEDDS